MRGFWILAVAVVVAGCGEKPAPKASHILTAPEVVAVNVWTPVLVVSDDPRDPDAALQAGLAIKEAADIIAAGHVTITSEVQWFQMPVSIAQLGKGEPQDIATTRVPYTDLATAGDDPRANLNLVDLVEEGTSAVSGEAFRRYCENSDNAMHSPKFCAQVAAL